jgi:molybdopterin-guanine dinucleotide biosynthesis protein A
MVGLESNRRRVNQLANDPKRTDCSGVILSGGLNSRMDGKNKGFLQVGGKPILCRLLERLRPLFGDILLVTKEPVLYADVPVKVVSDLYQDRSSLTGIHAAMVQATSAFGFVVPCDTPFLQSGVIRLLLDAVEPEVDIVVPLVEDRYEPLCAIYAKRCVPIIEQQLDRRDYTIFNFFHQVRVKTIPTDQILAVDPKLLSFFNVNTPEDYRTCLEMADKQSRSGASLS